MVEAAQSYEMVCKFNNFKAFVIFAVKNWKPCLSWTKNSEYGFFSPENFFLTMIMLVRKIFLTTWSKFVRLGQNRTKCLSKHDDPPMLMASRRPHPFHTLSTI